MKKFRIQASSNQILEIEIEASDEDAALEIANDIGMSDEKWVEVDSGVFDLNVVEVK